jgi:hypothetical protein
MNLIPTLTYTKIKSGDVCSEVPGRSQFGLSLATKYLQKRSSPSEIESQLITYRLFKKLFSFATTIHKVMAAQTNIDWNQIATVSRLIQELNIRVLKLTYAKIMSWI